MAMFMVKPWYKKKSSEIYGVAWSTNNIMSTGEMRRTDAAVGFSAPKPYYAKMPDMQESPSSPFDNIMPWSGIRRVTDPVAGELVEIPKFYYKWILPTNLESEYATIRLQICMEQKEGFLCSPAHADKGDGIGERDYVYVGRYYCASDYKSKTNQTPKRNITRATARSGIHNLASDVWQFDFAMYWTICMLFLVEFATWDSQKILGMGSSSTSSVTGSTDTMPYHTGTMCNYITTTDYSKSIQYRYIEDIWGYMNCYIDGIYFNNADVYVIKKPSSFSDSTGGTKVGERPTTSNWIKTWNFPNITGLEYALYPKTVYDSSSSAQKYIQDKCSYSSTGTILMLLFATGNNAGLFGLVGNQKSTYTGSNLGSRLQKLPSSRLT